MPTCMKITKTVKTEIEVEGLGAKIRRGRKLSDKTLKQLCKEAEVTTTHWYSIEKEEVGSLPIETLKKIEKVLEIDLEVNFDD